MPVPYRILLAEDYVLFRRELGKLINGAAGLKILGEVGDGAELYHFLEKAAPDLLVLDIYIPHLRAMEATRQIKQQYPGVKVLIMVMDHEEEYLTQARRVGADGILLKQYAAAELLQAISTIRAGKFYLPIEFQQKRSYIGVSFHNGTGLQLRQDTSR